MRRLDTFGAMLGYELRRRARRPMTWVCFALFFAFGFMGVFRAMTGNGLMATMTAAGRGNVSGVAPFAFHYYALLLTSFGMVVAAAWFGDAATRDVRLGTHHLYYTWPPGRLPYLASRFTGASLSVLFAFGGMGLGGMAASVLPAASAAAVAPGLYIHPYLVSVLPNILIVGALSFSVSLTAGRASAAWGALALVAALNAASMGLLRAGAETQASLVDPLGIMAVRTVFAYWSISERNSVLVPLAGRILANRVVWSAAGALALAAASRRFRMSLRSPGGGSLPVAAEIEPGKKVRPTGMSRRIGAERRFSATDRLSDAFVAAYSGVRHISRQPAFYVIVAAGLALVLFTGLKDIGIVRGTRTFPVTSQVLAAFKANLAFLGLITTLYCSSVLTWRRRSNRTDGIFDSLPVPDWVNLLGNLLAMAAVHAFVLALVALSGIAVQLSRGYFHIQPGLYAAELLGVQLTHYVFLSLFALFAQGVTGSRLAGWIVTLLFVDDLMMMIGLEHNLWTFAAIPAYRYSDMNGFGPYAPAIAAYDVYWAFFSILLAGVLLCVYPRGRDRSIRQRLRAVSRRLTRGVAATAAVGAAGCLAAGALILHETTRVNAFETASAAKERMADYEKMYSGWSVRPQPDVTAVEVEVGIFPHERRARAKGRMALENRSESPVDTLFLQAPREARCLELEVSGSEGPCAFDSRHGVYLFAFGRPLAPGASTWVDFDVELRCEGFRDRGEETRLVENGTFLTCVHLFPAPGYDPYGIEELEENGDRSKYGLEPVPRMAPASDAAARARTPIASHAGWIDFDAVVSTSADQVALAPGELLREWEEGERRYFHYRPETAILRYVAFLSARYEVRRERSGGRDIEIYYHPDHGRNLSLMAEAVRESLDLFSKVFGPYQFSTLRVAEFPRYEIFAEGFPGLVPVSEGYGFIADYDEKKLDEAYRMIAHEVGHQWWAHQVVGADVEGFFVLSEVMAQYSALLASKRRYGRPEFDEYVRGEISRYMRGRGAETEEEVPLARTNQATWYLHYAKGFVVMNALAEYLGEERVDAAAARFLESSAFRGAPYPVAEELVGLFREAATDSLKYLVDDAFERIVIYDNEALSATVTASGDGRSVVELDYEIRKLLADGSGRETPAPCMDLVEFAVFGRDGAELCRKRAWVGAGRGTIVLEADAPAAEAGVDPHYLLVDRDTANNRVPVRRAE